MFETFCEAAVRYDHRNSFSTYHGELEDFPSEVRAFYKEFNPIDVELDDDGLAVRFCAAEGLSNLQEEYSDVNAQFVFATCNGDPIFLDDSAVYTCSHEECDKRCWEKLADSFGDYINKFIF